MRVVTTVEPLVEPVSLAEAKLYSRVDLDIDDELIEIFITAARKHVEQYCNIALISQTRTVFYDSSDLCFAAAVLDLPFSPVQSISNFRTFDSDNVELEFPGSEYFISGSRLAINDGGYWPSDIRWVDAYSISAVVGYGDNPEDVPAPLRQAILRLVAHSYQNREAVYDSVNGVMVPNNVPYSVTCALMPYRVFVL